MEIVCNRNCILWLFLNEIVWNSVITPRKGLFFIVTEENNVMVNGEELIGATVYLTL
jgi:hypothetical protein